MALSGRDWRLQLRSINRRSSEPHFDSFLGSRGKGNYSAMAAYGLYSHIQSNRRRSIALLVGLFFLVYVLVYAGALLAAALLINANLDTLMQIAWTDLLKAAPFATLGTALWIVIAYYFHQDIIDALTGGREIQRADDPNSTTSWKISASRAAFPHPSSR